MFLTRITRIITNITIAIKQKMEAVDDFHSFIIFYSDYTFPKVYNWSSVGDLLPPAGSSVIP